MRLMKRKTPAAGQTSGGERALQKQQAKYNPFAARIKTTMAWLSMLGVIR